jgi:hypothetical protein
MAGASASLYEDATQYTYTFRLSVLPEDCVTVHESAPVASPVESLRYDSVTEPCAEKPPEIAK